MLPAKGQWVGMSGLKVALHNLRDEMRDKSLPQLTWILPEYTIVAFIMMILLLAVIVGPMTPTVVLLDFMSRAELVH